MCGQQCGHYGLEDGTMCGYYSPPSTGHSSYLFHLLRSLPAHHIVCHALCIPFFQLPSTSDPAAAQPWLLRVPGCGCGAGAAGIADGAQPSATTL